jgi:hypothetical protein
MRITILKIQHLFVCKHITSICNHITSTSNAEHKKIICVEEKMLVRFIFILKKTSLQASCNLVSLPAIA